MLKASFLTLLEKTAASRLFSFAVLAVAGLLAYSPGLNGEFLWDDSWLVQQNPFFKSPVFIFEVFRHYLFLEGTSTYYRPIQNISYMPDYWLWNGNPYGYHLSNILFHVVSGWLLFRLVNKVLPVLSRANEEKSKEQPTQNFLTKHRTAIAFVVALIWVVHPIHNAAVAYVSGRADSLASMFALAAWLLYLNARRFVSVAVRFGLYAIALLLCLLAVCSKEIAIVWFSLFVFYTLVFDKGPRLREKLAAFAGVALVVCCCWWLRHLPAGPAAGVAADDTKPPIAERGIMALRALGDYTGLIFFPANLHMDRTVYRTEAYSNMRTWQASIWLEYLSLIGAATLAVFTILCWKNLPGRRLRIFGAGWFMIGFLPISNLFPLNAQAAEHWIYMPSFGFLLFLAGCVAAMPARARTVAVTIALVAIPALIFRTSKRAYEWADAERFYVQTIQSGGGSARINLNLALVYSSRGDVKKAEQMLRGTLRHAPDYLPARLNLGINLLNQGRGKEAEEFLKFDKTETQKMAAEQPHTWSAALNLAKLRHSQKRSAEALSILDESMPSYPNNWDLVELKARILRETSGAGAAIPGVETYAKAHWWHYNSQMALGRLRSAQGDADGAIGALQNAGKLDVHAVAPFEEIAHIFFEEKKFGEAAQASKCAIHRDPNQIRQYLFLATIYEQMGRKEDAAAVIRTAEELRKTVGGDFKHL